MSRVYRGDGFEVRGEGMHSFRYKEKYRSAILNAERLSGFNQSPSFLLYPKTARWDDGIPVTDEERSFIVRAISDALEHFNIKYEVGL